MRDLSYFELSFTRLTIVEDQFFSIFLIGTHNASSYEFSKNSFVLQNNKQKLSEYIKKSETILVKPSSNSSSIPYSDMAISTHEVRKSNVDIIW